MIDPPWSQPERLPNAGDAERTFTLVADEPTRAAIAKVLDLPALHRLEGEVRMRPWLDGAELRGAWSAAVTYACGLTLEPFDKALEGAFTLRVVPAGSPLAPSEESEIAVDPEADDPPDVLEGATVDVAGYLVEHFALELDSFPRKPGAAFEPPPEPPEPSPFDALSRLRPPGSGSA